MKRTLFFTFLSLTILSLNAQNFTWIHGSNTAGSQGAYGTLGASSATNDPGGRHGCVTWTDQNGDLWLFGGEGYSNSTTVCWMNDLWKYNRATNEWTWMHGSNGPNSTGSYGTMGVAASTNEPSAREFAKGWVDANGKLWMFGGEMGPGFKYSDLWKYDPTTNQWTWMNGSSSFNTLADFGTIGIAAPTNSPGARSGQAVWTDTAGDLWMFGGRGFVATGFYGFLSDIWKYNITSNQWTWMSGANATSQPPTYGTIGVSSNTNTPGGREFPSYWKDHNDKLYLFGGRGSGYYGDLWKYDPVADTWVWLKGPNVSNQASVYGTQGISAPGNNPGGRFTGASWLDNHGYLWLFGGQAWATIAGVNPANDLWRYDPCMNEWTFMKGGMVTNQSGNYGTIGVPANTNMPGARFHNNWWADPQGQFWLFGGEGYDAASTAINHMNDLWKYNPPLPTYSLQSISGNQHCTGITATLNANAAPGITVNWYSSSTSTNIIATGSSYTTGLLTAIGNTSLYTYYAQTTCSLLPHALITITIDPLPIITITSPASVCTGSSFTMQVSGAATYTWVNGSNSAVISETCPAVGYTTTVLGTSSVGCENSSNKNIVALALPTVSVQATNTFVCRYDIKSITATGATTYSWNNIAGPVTQTFQSMTATTTTVYLDGVDNNGCVNTYSFALKFVICGGISENGIDHLPFTVYPNPTGGKFRIKQNTQSNETYTVSIYNSIGSLVFLSKVQDLSNELAVDLPAGFYRIVIEGAATRGSQNLIIE